MENPDSRKQELEENHLKSNMRKVALTALSGTSIEWYDFFLFNTPPRVKG